MLDSSWLIRETEIPSTNPDVLSTLFCVGNGQTTTRGTLSEQRLEAFRGVYISGRFTRAGYGLLYFMGAPDWLPAFIQGEPVTHGERTLDMLGGVLRRTATTAGATLTEERFASLADPRIMGQRITLETTQPLTFVLGVDGEIRNHRAKYYKPGQFPNSDQFGLRLSTIESISAGEGKLHVGLKSRSTETRAAITAQVVGPPAATYLVEDGRALAKWELVPGKHVFEKVCALDADPGQLGYAEALEAHQLAMGRFWAVADVQIEGDEFAQKAVRYALWSTRIAAANDDGASSIGAKNLTGDWYRGAVFWDMEMYQLPMLVAVAPELARNHVLYRVKRLGAARILAGQDGYAGARYPWQSYNSGLEEPPVMGGFLYMQQHLNLAIAWGIRHFQELTGEPLGTDVLIEVARFFASRVQEGHIHGCPMRAGTRCPSPMTP